MKHDVPAPHARQLAEDPTALLGYPWAHIDLPHDRPRARGPLAAVWPFRHQHKISPQPLALLGDNPNHCSPGQRG